ncbi:MAG: T9SS type A sorting domain-containing protein, partial [Marinilabilia sp.]
DGSNHVRYSASGNASVTIGDNASFELGSQIYRNSEGGILKFYQTHSTSSVQIGTIDAPEGNHPVFEILNDDSEFVQSKDESDVSILRGQSEANEPAFVFDPATVDIAAGSNFILGEEGNQAMDIFADQPLEGLEVAGGSDITLKTSSLILNGGLIIGENSEFDANGLDVTFYGDLDLDGTSEQGAYIPNGNTSYFESDDPQSINGDVDFHNLASQSGTGTLTIGSSSTVLVNNDLELLDGTINTDGSDLEVKGDVTTDLETKIEGLAMIDDNEMQLIEGGGEIGRLTINNPEDVMVPGQPDPILVTEELRLASGVFNIGGNLLKLSENTEIVDGSGGTDFSETNMIQTFLSFTDAGIQKHFPEISEPQTFIYPIGSQNKYTPVTLDIDEIGSTDGSIRVKAANERHVSILDQEETDFNDQENVLQYYWTLDADGISGFSGDVDMQAYEDDVLVTADGKTKEDYITARILFDDDEWVPGNTEAFDVTDNILTFDRENFFNGTDDLGIDGDYTAGIPEAIPERVPTYISVVENGNWQTKDTWAVYNPDNGDIGEPGENVQGGGPTGCIVYVDKDVNVISNGRRAYRTYITEGATLDFGETYNNRLGDVLGSGRLRVEKSSLPAGSYDGFFEPDGGTLEYGGTGDLSVLSETETLNNLEFTGGGSRTLPDVATIRLYGDLLVDGPDVKFSDGTSIEIEGDLNFNSGSMDVGDDNVFKFNGSEPQFIGGDSDYSGDNALREIKINNPAGLKLESNVEVAKLDLTQGVIYSTDAAKLSVVNISASVYEGAITGGSSSSYVDGPMVRYINGSSLAEFPVGDDGRYGLIEITDNSDGGDWEVQYYNEAHADGGKYEQNDIAYVSNNEYWSVDAPSTSDAEVTLYWDSESGVNPDDDNFRMISYDKSLNDPSWVDVVDDYSINMDLDNENVISDELQHDTERLFTFGSASIADYTWLGSVDDDWFNGDNWEGDVAPSASNKAIVDNTAVNDPVVGENADAFCNDLEISDVKSLILKPGSSLEISNDVDNSGTIVLESTNDNLASLMLPEAPTNSGEVNVQLELEADGKWYLGSPLKDETSGKPKVEWFYPDNDPDNDYVYVLRDLNDNGRGEWIRVDENGIDGDPYLYDLEFVAANYKNQKTLDLTGNVYDEEVTRTISGKPGYTLVGNPYLSAIDWGELDGWGRDGFTETMYSLVTVEQDGEEERVLQTVNSNGIYTIKPDGYDDSEVTHIAPFQAVWVKKDIEEDVDFTIKPQARVKNTGIPLKSSSSGEKESYDMIRIHSHNEQSLDGAVLYFSDKFNSGKGREDSEKKFNSSKNVPEVYTRIDSEAISINGQPALGEDKYEYPLSVRNRLEGEVTLSVDLEQFNYDYDVMLEDKEEGTYTNLRDVNEYSYTPVEMGKDHDRFVLHLEKIQQVPTDIEDIADDKADGISITRSGDYALIIIGPALLQNGNADIELLDINGRLIHRLESNDSETRVKLPENSGTYIVRVNAGGQIETGKIVR